MKDKQTGISVEKIIEKKKKMVMEAKSTILPLLNTKVISPGNSSHHEGSRNFFNDSQRIKDMESDPYAP